MSCTYHVTRHASYPLMLLHNHEALNFGAGREVHASNGVRGAMSHPEGANSSSSSGWAKVPYAAEVSGFISGQKEEVEENGGDKRMRVCKLQ